MSIQVMTWAFTLPLPPPLKLTLLAVSDNANDDGIAWPGQGTIAKKSTQSRSTVGRQLKRLEAMGVLQRFERFREDGSQSSDEIRIDLGLSADEVGQRYAALKRSEKGLETGDDEDEGGYQNDTPPSQSSDMPGASIVTPPNEPSLEPNHSPNPSPGRGGLSSDGHDLEGEDEPEPEHFSGFFESCLHWRTMSRDKALAAFRFLTLDEQKLARAASPWHAQECTKAKRRSLDAHKLIAERFWTRYPDARLAEPRREPERRFVQGDELVGAEVALRMMGLDLKLINEPGRGLGYWTTRALQPDLVALSQFAREARAWFMVDEGSGNFAAWRDRLKLWTGVELEAERIWTEPHDPAVHDISPLDRNWRRRKSKRVLRVPELWPPHRDGSWKKSTEGDAA